MMAPASDLYKSLLATWSAVPPWQREDVRWVMSRSWYDRVRAMAVTEEQERARAAAHAQVYVAADGPLSCTVCPAGPFSTMAQLVAHVAAMADPANREPSARDYLLGIPIEVREDGDEPHFEAPRHVTQVTAVDNDAD